MEVREVGAEPSGPPPTCAEVVKVGGVSNIALTLVQVTSTGNYSRAGTGRHLYGPQAQNPWHDPHMLSGTPGLVPATLSWPARCPIPPPFSCESPAPDLPPNPHAWTPVPSRETSSPLLHRLGSQPPSRPGKDATGLRDYPTHCLFWADICWCGGSAPLAWPQPNLAVRFWTKVLQPVPRPSYNSIFVNKIQ